MQETINKLNQLTGQEQVAAVGETLYPLVSKLYPMDAGRITSMMLEYNINEVIEFITDPAQLREITGQAMQLLNPAPPLKPPPPVSVYDPALVFQTHMDANEMDEGDRTDDQEI